MFDGYKIIPTNVKGIENLKVIYKRNVNRIIIAHLNINFLRNKFDSLMKRIMGNIGILMTYEIVILVFQRVSF